MNSFKYLAFCAVLAAGAAVAQVPPPEQVEPQKSVSMPEFRTLDINGDGRVSEQEAQANATVWEKFAELDTDKNGSLSTDEYAKAKNMDKHRDNGKGQEKSKY